MAELELNVERRESTGKEIAKKLRRDGRVPAIVYGGHREPVSITVDRKSLSEMISKSEHGVRSIFLLKMAGSDQQRHAMIKDVQIDPISRKMTHIDFVRVVMDEKIKVTVPLHTTGASKGVKEGGILDFQMREIHVECLPNAIPDEIAIDVTELGVHEFLRVADLKVPEGVRVLDDSERVVLSVTVPRAEVVAEPTVVEPVEPELIKKGKTEEEAEEK